MVHLQRRLRRQPGSEGKDALRLILPELLRHQKRSVTADLRAIVACSPRYQYLWLREQQRPEAVGLGLQIPDFGAQPRLDSWRGDPPVLLEAPPPQPKSRAAPVRSSVPRFPGG